MAAHREPHPDQVIEAELVSAETEPILGPDSQALRYAVEAAIALKAKGWTAQEASTFVKDIERQRRIPTAAEAGQLFATFRENGATPELAERMVAKTLDQITQAVKGDSGSGLDILGILGNLFDKLDPGVAGAAFAMFFPVAFAAQRSARRGLPTRVAGLPTRGTSIAGFP
ncbi:MAG: hypothetical protein ACKVPX_11370 [Myxococcaceae bacterium]